MEGPRLFPRPPSVARIGAAQSGTALFAHPPHGASHRPTAPTIVIPDKRERRERDRGPSKRWACRERRTRSPPRLSPKPHRLPGPAFVGTTARVSNRRVGRAHRRCACPRGRDTAQTLRRTGSPPSAWARAVRCRGRRYAHPTALRRTPSPSWPGSSRPSTSCSAPPTFAWMPGTRPGMTIAALRTYPRFPKLRYTHPVPVHEGRLRRRLGMERGAAPAGGEVACPAVGRPLSPSAGTMTGCLLSLLNRGPDQSAHGPKPSCRAAFRLPGYRGAREWRAMARRPQQDAGPSQWTPPAHDAECGEVCPKPPRGAPGRRPFL